MPSSGLLFRLVGLNHWVRIAIQNVEGVDVVRIIEKQFYNHEQKEIGYIKALNNHARYYKNKSVNQSHSNSIPIEEHHATSIQHITGIHFENIIEFLQWWEINNRHLKLDVNNKLIANR